MGRPKNKKDKYSCNYCDYKTSCKSDWNKHLKTAKHQKNLKNSRSGTKTKQGFILCNFCNKTYKHLSSYSRHKKKCENTLHKKNAKTSQENFLDQELADSLKTNDTPCPNCDGTWVIFFSACESVNVKDVEKLVFRCSTCKHMWLD